MSFLRKWPFLYQGYRSSISYPAPSNLTYSWNFGLLGLFFLGVQIITGLFLSMHYLPSLEYAFFSVEHIMRDIHFGWLFRYLHANGASFFFIVIYLHIFRGIYYASYSIHSSRYWLWAVGVLIFFFMIIIAFLGYVLPWGQMSFWGATVITNLVGAIPIIGDQAILLLWGSFYISQPTLERFFTLHFLLPAILVVLVIVHLALLHEYHSSNPLGVNFSVDSINFYPLYIWKDLLGFLVCLTVYLGFVFFAPNALSHSINYIEADPLVTPPHIVPEWYFLPFYAILRSVPNKLLGVLALLYAILILLLIPFLTPSTELSPYYNPRLQKQFWAFLLTWIMLTYLGACPAEAPYTYYGWAYTLRYFTVWLPFAAEILAAIELLLTPYLTLLVDYFELYLGKAQRHFFNCMQKPQARRRFCDLDILSVFAPVYRNIQWYYIAFIDEVILNSPRFLMECYDSLIDDIIFILDKTQRMLTYIRFRRILLRLQIHLYILQRLRPCRRRLQLWRKAREARAEKKTKDPK
jgi:ubiquinol-cytochrome c reductase cytochrome b subunit